MRSIRNFPLTQMAKLLLNLSVISFAFQSPASAATKPLSKSTLNWQKAGASKWASKNAPIGGGVTNAKDIRDMKEWGFKMVKSNIKLMEDHMRKEKEPIPDPKTIISQEAQIQLQYMVVGGEGWGESYENAKLELEKGGGELAPNTGNVKNDLRILAKRAKDKAIADKKTQKGDLKRLQKEEADKKKMEYAAWKLSARGGKSAGKSREASVPVTAGANRWQTAVSKNPTNTNKFQAVVKKAVIDDNISNNCEIKVPDLNLKRRKLTEKLNRGFSFLSKKVVWTYHSVGHARKENQAKISRWGHDKMKKYTERKNKGENRLLNGAKLAWDLLNGPLKFIWDSAKAAVYTTLRVNIVSACNFFFPVIGGLLGGIAFDALASNLIFGFESVCAGMKGMIGSVVAAGRYVTGKPVRVAPAGSLRKTNEERKNDNVASAAKILQQIGDKKQGMKVSQKKDLDGYFTQSDLSQRFTACESKMMGRGTDFGQWKRLKAIYNAVFIRNRNTKRLRAGLDAGLTEDYVKQFKGDTEEEKKNNAREQLNANLDAESNHQKYRIRGEAAVQLIAFIVQGFKDSLFGFGEFGVVQGWVDMNKAVDPDASTYIITNLIKSIKEFLKAFIEKFQGGTFGKIIQHIGTVAVKAIKRNLNPINKYFQKAQKCEKKSKIQEDKQKKSAADLAAKKAGLQDRLKVDQNTRLVGRGTKLSEDEENCVCPDGVTKNECIQMKKTRSKRSGNTHCVIAALGEDEWDETQFHSKVELYTTDTRYRTTRMQIVMKVLGAVMKGAWFFGIDGVVTVNDNGDGLTTDKSKWNSIDGGKGAIAEVNRQIDVAEAEEAARDAALSDRDAIDLGIIQNANHGLSPEEHTGIDGLNGNVAAEEAGGIGANTPAGHTIPAAEAAEAASETMNQKDCITAAGKDKNAENRCYDSIFGAVTAAIVTSMNSPLKFATDFNDGYSGNVEGAVDQKRGKEDKYVVQEQAASIFDKKNIGKLAAQKQERQIYEQKAKNEKTQDEQTKKAADRLRALNLKNRR